MVGNLSIPYSNASSLLSIFTKTIPLESHSSSIFSSSVKACCDSPSSSSSEKQIYNKNKKMNTYRLNYLIVYQFLWGVFLDSLFNTDSCYYYIIIYESGAWNRFVIWFLFQILFQFQFQVRIPSSSNWN